MYTADIINLLHDVWQKMPDMSMSQLMWYLASGIKKDPRSMSDDDLLLAIQKFNENLQQR